MLIGDPYRAVDIEFNDGREYMNVPAKDYETDEIGVLLRRPHPTSPTITRYPWSSIKSITYHEMES